MESQWIPGGDRFFFRAKGRDGVRFWPVDPVVKSQLELFDRAKLASRMTKFTGDHHAVEALDVKEFEFDAEQHTIQFTSGEKRFDMFVVPGVRHGLGDWRCLYTLFGTTSRPT